MCERECERESECVGMRDSVYVRERERDSENDEVYQIQKGPIDFSVRENDSPSEPEITFLGLSPDRPRSRSISNRSDCLNNNFINSLKGKLVGRNLNETR